VCLSSNVGMHEGVSGLRGIVRAQSIPLRQFGDVDSSSGHKSILFYRARGIFQFRKLWGSGYVGCGGNPNATWEERP
jgi:hypothetical protein